MEATSFSKLFSEVNSISDLILSAIKTSGDKDSTEKGTFKKHLETTKNWFAHISCANKKHYALALLEDVRCMWTLSLLLKSIWNCRTKDAVASAYEYEQYPWSSCDQAPMDHNRTATPLSTLAEVMRSDRVWFSTLEPEAQAMVLTELLTVAGGPVMWAVLRRAQTLFEWSYDMQMQELSGCVVNEPLLDKGQQTSPEKKKDQKHSRKGSATSSVQPNAAPGQSQKELEENLMAWNATIKSLKDSIKLEELEITFNYGTKKKIWKVNRSRPEAMETVDYIQLLPSSIAKQILSYLPTSQFNELARVNKYWAFLIDEYRSETNVRSKINLELEKLHEIMQRNDKSKDTLELQTAKSSSQSMNAKNILSNKASKKHGVPSTGDLNTKLRRKAIMRLKPIRKMKELTERLERRGAADEMTWKWCENVIRYVGNIGKEMVKEGTKEGVLPLKGMHFPCPLMTRTLILPLVMPLVKDPTMLVNQQPQTYIPNTDMMPEYKETGCKRSLWRTNVSSFYSVFKIPSYQLPLIPANEEWRALWITSKNLDNNVSKFACVCSLHFNQDDYLTEAKKKLTLNRCG